MGLSVMRVGAIPYSMGYGMNGSVSGALGSMTGVKRMLPVGAAGTVDGTRGVEGSRAAKRVGKAECQTCKSRKYKDGSDEMVSFKSATHISPQSAGAAVMAHEQEHVSNAYKKAALNDGKVLQASVQLHMGVCPECGRSYVAGGTTSTKIQYNEDNPYEKNAKSLQAEAFKGNNIDVAV
ncbi:MAG: hypothetical protein K2L18_01675 [Acetatifactor sp.]|nr:hypothetical protein [Acetatifactor sp.]